MSWLTRNSSDAAQGGGRRELRLAKLQHFDIFCFVQGIMIILSVTTPHQSPPASNQSCQTPRDLPSARLSPLLKVVPKGVESVLADLPAGRCLRSRDGILVVPTLAQAEGQAVGGEGRILSQQVVATKILRRDHTTRHEGLASFHTADDKVDSAHFDSPSQHLRRRHPKRQDRLRPTNP